MSIINYEERAVAFIDVLGFKTLVANSVSNSVVLQDLQNLVDLLDSAIPALNSGVSTNVPTALHPAHTYISDCLILSAPLSVSILGWEKYNGLEVLVMRAIQLTHRFLQAGFLLRGGISVGKVWHSSTNVIGPAYQEAYLLETSTCYPRIELTETAKSYWSNGFCATSRMCIDYCENSWSMGCMTFTYLEAWSASKLKKNFKKYGNKAKDNASDKNLRVREQQKWQWFLDYILSEQKRLLP
jgi:hypothetical protein